jgi:ribosome-binding factor A
MSRRTEKIASELRSEVARLLREEVTDPRIGLVTLTRVDVAPDLSNALLYYSVMGAESADAASIERVDDGLHSAAPFLRRRAARTLSLKRMPELRFRYDPSLSLAADTLSLLRSLGEREAPAGEQGEDESATTDATRSQADDETA